MKKGYIMAPGPTPVPEDVLREIASPIIHHRTSEYQEIFKKANEGLKYLFNTENDIFTFASSGTGAMEAAVTNMLSTGDKAIVVRGGKFGERFAEICTAYKIEVIPIDVEWGKPVDSKIIKKILEANRDVKAVFATLCETSTGTKNDIEGISCIRPNATFYLWPNVTGAMQRTGLTDYDSFRRTVLQETGVSCCTRIHFGRPLEGEDNYYIRMDY